MPRARAVKQGAGVTPVEQLGREVLERLFARFGLAIHWLGPEADIPGTFWGAPEAGLVGNQLFLRPDTPVHSALHEGCHWICMDDDRRQGLDTDAGGSDAEESAVCYLQVLLADQLPGYDRNRLWRDMDAWGYSYRLGSAQAWFEQDAEDAFGWLRDHRLIDPNGMLLWQLRKSQ